MGGKPEPSPCFGALWCPGVMLALRIALVIDLPGPCLGGQREYATVLNACIGAAH